MISIRLDHVQLRATSGILSGMTGRDGDRSIDFFISYSPADERWATWIAWQLEAEGYRALIQAWDFVPGTNFIDFMDRGVRDAAVVVCVLSRNYLTSRYGTMEWQAALRTDKSKLVTIRVEDCPIDGLLATITYLDMLHISDDRTARQALLERMRQMLAGRAKPDLAPGFPSQRSVPGEVLRHGDGMRLPELDHDRSKQPPGAREPARTRRTPVAAPTYPPAGPSLGGHRENVSVLHVPGPRFGRGMAGPDEPLSARDLQSQIWANVTRLTDAGVAAPDLIVVSGDLTESARPREVDEALTFLTGLRVLLGLDAHRMVIVPGGRDVSQAACLSYFARCEARDVQPQPPYYPKLEHYEELFADLYQGLDGPVFDVAQPWTLFAVPELKVSVAALNSTMATSHRPEDDYGLLGEAQAAWFAERLRSFEESGWLRLGVVRHVPGPPGGDPGLLRDVGTLDRILGNRLNFLLHGPHPTARAPTSWNRACRCWREPVPAGTRSSRSPPTGCAGSRSTTARSTTRPNSSGASGKRWAARSPNPPKTRHRGCPVLHRGPNRGPNPNRNARHRRDRAIRTPCCWNASRRSARRAIPMPRSAESTPSRHTC